MNHHLFTESLGRHASPASWSDTCRLVTVPEEMIELLSLAPRSSAREFAEAMFARASAVAKDHRVAFWSDVIDGLS